jgi:hypothetical protein
MPTRHGTTTLPIMTDEMDAALIRLQFVVYHQRRAEPALADDLEAVIRYAKSDPASRQIDAQVLTRLERRAGQATVENQPSLANDLTRAMELVHKLQGAKA